MATFKGIFILCVFGPHLLFATLCDDGLIRAGKKATMAGLSQSVSLNPGNFQIIPMHEGISGQKVARHTYSPNGSRYVELDPSGLTGRVRDASTHEALFELPGATDRQILTSAAFSPDGKHLVTVNGLSSEGSLIEIRDANTGKHIYPSLPVTVPIPYIDKIEFSKDGSKILLFGEHKPIVSVFSPESMKLISYGEPHAGMPATIVAATISPDGTQVAYADMAKNIIVRTIATGAMKSLGLPHKDGIAVLKFSPDGKSLLSTDRGGKVLLSDLGSGKSKALAIHKDNVYSAEFSADGSKIVSASADGTVGIVDLLANKGYYLPDSMRASAVFDGSGTKVVTCDLFGDRVAVWNASNGKLLFDMRLNPGPVSGEFTPDGSSIVISTRDGKYRVFSISESKK